MLQEVNGWRLSLKSLDFPHRGNPTLNLALYRLHSVAILISVFEKFDP